MDPSTQRPHAWRLLRFLLEEVSALVGRPVLVVDRTGRFACTSGGHPCTCPLDGAATCPVARRVSARRLQDGPCIVRYRGVPHVVVATGTGDVPGPLVVVDGWAPCGRAGVPRAVPLRRMRRGARLAAALVGWAHGKGTWRDAVGCEPPPSQGPPSRPWTGDGPPSAVRRYGRRGDGGSALVHQWLTPQGIARLRDAYRLTWREIDILLRYYLVPPSPGEEASTRRALARQLGLTDGTLRAYVNGIRAKLGLRARRGALAYWAWARAEGMLRERDL
ncbi:MAG: hypothetical protein QN157_08605 [Armatimonadota bacterium]|nr:hypothetical protein [Armatimonadota bacterium]